MLNIFFLMLSNKKCIDLLNSGSSFFGSNLKSSQNFCSVLLLINWIEHTKDFSMILNFGLFICVFEYSKTLKTVRKLLFVHLDNYQKIVFTDFSAFLLAKWTKIYYIQQKKGN